MILFKVREEDQFFDVIVEECLIDQDKYILIKRDNGIDMVCGVFRWEQLRNKEFVKKIVGV